MLRAVVVLLVIFVVATQQNSRFKKQTPETTVCSEGHLGSNRLLLTELDQFHLSLLAEDVSSLPPLLSWTTVQSVCLYRHFWCWEIVSLQSGEKVIIEVKPD